MDAVAQEIDKWLKVNDRRRNNGLRKQCLKCADLHRELIAKELDISYSCVCKYIHKKSEKSPKPKDVYLRAVRNCIVLVMVECGFFTELGIGIIFGEPNV